MLDARFWHLYYCQSLHTLQRGLSAITDLLVDTGFRKFDLYWLNMCTMLC